MHHPFYVSICLLSLVFAALSALPCSASTTVVVWADSSSQSPEYSVLTASSWSTPSSALDVGASPRWVVLESCPTRVEFACGTQDSSSDINLQFFDGTTWSSLTELSSSAGTGSTKRAFDLAYEGTSGNLLVVYSDNGEGNLGYRTSNGSTLSAESDLSKPGSGNSSWIALYNDPTSDTIILLHLGSDLDLDANVWDGSSWGGWSELTSDTGVEWTERSALCFEYDSGDAVVVYRGTYDDTYYRTWDGSSWSGATLLASNEYMTFVSLAACQQAGSDEIAMGYVTYYDDVVWRVWDGSSWSSATTVETSTPDWDYRCVDVSYERDGGDALLVYSQSSSNSVRYRTWNGTTLSSEATGASLGGRGGFLQLTPGVSPQEILLASGDSSHDVNLVGWDGSSFGSTTERETSLYSDSSVQRHMIAVSTASTLFTDVSADSGFDVQTTTDYHDGSGSHWGDLDNDGDLDAIITGDNSSRLLIYDLGAGTYTVSTFGGGSRERQGVLLDGDNDGDLDFWHQDEKYYENDGSASFTDRGNVGMSGPSNGENAVATDVDHDGWVDLVMFSGNTKNWIGSNDGSASLNFTDSNSSSTGLNDSGDYGNGDFIATGDVNQDGYTDFYYNYSTGKLFLSDGDGTYTENASGMSHVTGNSDKTGPMFGDYDGDGDLDFYQPRYDAGNQGYLYRNDSGTFTDVTTTAGILDTSGQRTAAWGDYDNDGDLDLYIATHSGNANLLYSNDGDGTFTLESGHGAEAAGDAHDAVFVDVDNDGDLDLAITQEDATNTLLRNNTDSTDYLKVRLVGYGAGATNKACNGVRVELYDAPGTTYLGQREVGMARGFAGAEPMWLHFGGINNTATYTLKVYFDSMPVGEPYTTTVVPSAVSTTIGSTTIGQMITISEPPPLFTDVSSSTSFDVVTDTNGDGSGLHWGDLNDDGFLDVVVTGNATSRVLISSNATSFSSSTLGNGSQERQGALADFDNDGDLDFYFYRDYYYETHFENDGAGSLTDLGDLGASDPHNNEGLVAADVDHDGYCDVVLFSANNNWVCHHQGTDPVTLVATAALSFGLNDSGDYGNGDFASSCDVNEDGYVDFFYHWSSGLLWLSDGDGTYTQTNNGISVHTGGSDKMGSAWGDYDNDGDVDLFVCRYDSGQRGYLWRNDSGTFTDVTVAAGVDNTSGQKSCTWGDYDNDGDLDLYVTTHTSGANILYDNNGDGTFTRVSKGAAISGAGNDACFVDYDNDGDLDLSLTRTSSGNVLLENGTDDENYLKVRLIGGGEGKTNLACTGVRIELYDSSGATFIARRDIGGARGHGGGEPLWAHFGGLLKTTTYTLKVYFEGSPVTSPYTTTVVPGSVSTTIGATTIPQLITITEPSGVTITNWNEIRR